MLILVSLLHFAEYRKKQDILKDKRKRFEQIDDEYYASVLHLLKLAKDAPKLFQSASIEQKRILRKTLGSNFSLNGDLLRLKLKEPFEIMVLCNKNQLGSGSWARTSDLIVNSDPLYH